MINYSIAKICGPNISNTIWILHAQHKFHVQAILLIYSELGQQVGSQTFIFYDYMKSFVYIKKSDLYIMINLKSKYTFSQSDDSVI